MKKINIRSIFKSLFFRLRLDIFIPSGFLIFIGHMAKLSKWIHRNKNIEFCDFPTSKFIYTKRESLFKHIIATQQLDSAIDYLEFGVSKGSSFKWWVNYIKHPQARFYGFDTFTGLPEAWGNFKKGDFSSGNQMPEIEGQRHWFFQGLFQQTLLKFLSTYKAEKRKVIHMDADIYSATLYVLTLITPYLKSGDIIFFDEFNVPMHEFKAFTEWVSSFYIDYEVLGSVNNFYQTAIMIR